MNLIVISKMSIYDELAYKCREQKMQIEMREAIEAVRTINRSYDIIKSIKESDAIIFQSKNAVLYSSDYHELMDNCKNYYCIGKYTAKIINDMINQDALYPKNEYSSEALIEEITKSNEKDKKFVVIKGVGGREYIEANLAQSNNVNIVEVYERKRINNFISESDLKKNDNNYILASSKEAYDHFVALSLKFMEGAQEKCEDVSYEATVKYLADASVPEGFHDKDSNKNNENSNSEAEKSWKDLIE
mgnify:CR=1 FL=1